MQPDEARLENEKTQMLVWWRRRLHARCWIADPPPALRRICKVAVADLNGQLRQLHDFWGYCAKGTLDSGGLCAGAIYRTSDFIALPQSERRGVRGGTVHIEHSVPIVSLACQIAGMDAALRSDERHMLGWLLRHSVTCAFARGQERFRRPFSKSTNAFDPVVGAEFGRPFARYNHLSSGPVEIWNIWSGDRIPIDEWTFEDHMATVQAILAECGTSDLMRETL